MITKLESEFMLAGNRWFRDDGNNTLRLNYDLNCDSIVFDIGGYKGDFAEEIVRLYDCHVYLFEPSVEFFRIAQARFSANKKVKCFNYGLSDSNCKMMLSNEGNKSSVMDVKSHQTGSQVDIQNFKDVFDREGIEDIDLIKINIEGGEYPLMRHIIKEGLAPRIKNFQVQFHIKDFIPNVSSMREDIQHALSETHNLDWCYTFIWENWSLKD